MKFRESGMPDQEMWDQFFNSNVILDALGLRDLTGNIVGFGMRLWNIHNPSG